VSADADPARPAARGRLRIYLGYAPGAGTTCALLSEGRRGAERGTDVVVASADTHGRPHTEGLLAGLEVIPPAKVSYRGGTVAGEMDLGAVLARGPAVALVDDFAHRNAPGSRHRARWQDVEDLLAAGIDVISTIRVAPKPQLLEWVTTMNAAVQARENMQYARRRWLILATVAIAQLMIILDVTIVNVALPSAQRSLHFITVDRQWVVTAYALAFGSLLLLGGRLADLLGRKITFIAGLAGFAVASVVGGASVNFAMLVTARACQGGFAAVMAPSALSILTNTFADPRDRGKAFAVFGAIAAAGGAVGLLLGGVLTEYLSWRWTLYVNLLFAGAALAGAAALLTREPARGGQRLDVPGAVLVGGAMFCLVYGFANAATHSWHAPSTWGFLAAAVAGLAAFAGWQARAKDPLLPPRVVLNRNRGGAYLAMLFVSAGAFAILLLLTFYLQITLRYSPLVTGLAFLPYPAAVVVSVNVGQIVLMPRTGPKPLVGLGLLIAAGGMVWLTRIGVHSGYASAVLGPLLVTGLGIGQVIAPAANTGTFGVAPWDAGVAAATVNAGQQAGGSIGTSLLNTMVASATASYLASHLNPGTILAGRPSGALVQQSLVHGYTVGFWWTAGIFAVGAVVCGTLLRRGPLRPRQEPAATAAQPRAVQPEPPSVRLKAD
jgi:EmrB/QacA subfamily drug resistance transporter